MQQKMFVGNKFHIKNVIGPIQSGTFNFLFLKSFLLHGWSLDILQRTSAVIGLAIPKAGTQEDSLSRS
jgi:hypothetical protein